MYESICSLCNPGAIRKGKLEKTENAPSLYVGKSSRTVQGHHFEQAASSCYSADLPMKVILDSSGETGQIVDLKFCLADISPDILPSRY